VKINNEKKQRFSFLIIVPSLVQHSRTITTTIESIVIYIYLHVYIDGIEVNFSTREKIGRLSI